MNDQKSIQPAKTYDCKCLKCGQDFQSKNEIDLDGDGICSLCYAKGQEIAKKVDAQIAINRANRPVAIPVSFAPTAANGQSGFMGIKESIRQ